MSYDSRPKRLMAALHSTVLCMIWEQIVGVPIVIFFLLVIVLSAVALVKGWHR